MGRRTQRGLFALAITTASELTATPLISDYHIREFLGYPALMIAKEFPIKWR